LLAVGLHTCTAVARSLCVSWAFLLLLLENYVSITALPESLISLPPKLKIKLIFF